MPERDVDAAAPPVTGEMLAAISREIVRLKAQHYGWCARCGCASRSR